MIDTASCWPVFMAGIVIGFVVAVMLKALKKDGRGGRAAGYPLLL